MMRRFVAALALGLALYSPSALADERCLAAQYRLPPSIAKEMRPYLLCGLIHERSDTGTMINGVHVFMGMGTAGCGDVRARALQESEWRLASTMPDPRARQAFLETEFRKADEFIQSTKHLDDLGIGQEPNARPCRNNDASH